MRSTEDPSSRSSSAVTTRCTEVSSHAGSGGPHARANPDAAAPCRDVPAAESRRFAAVIRRSDPSSVQALRRRIRCTAEVRLPSDRDRARDPAASAPARPRRVRRFWPLAIAALAIAAVCALAAVRPWAGAPGAVVAEAQDAAPSVIAPIALALPDEPRVLIFGDSWTYGSAAALPTLGYAYVVGERLGWQTTVDGVRGSGYLKPGLDGGAYGERIAALDPALDPDLIIIEGSINDRRLPATGYREAVTAAWDSLAALYPSASIVVLGPAPQVLPVEEATARIDADLSALAAARGWWYISPDRRRVDLRGELRRRHRHGDRPLPPVDRRSRVSGEPAGRGPRGDEREHDRRRRRSARRAPRRSADAQGWRRAGDNLDRYASVAQGIERWFPVPKVAGSIPVGGTDARPSRQGRSSAFVASLLEATRSRAHAARGSARRAAASGEAVGIQSGARREAVPKGRLLRFRANVRSARSRSPGPIIRDSWSLCPVPLRVRFVSVIASQDQRYSAPRQPSRGHPEVTSPCT